MLELKMDDCLTRGDSSQLVSLLHYEGLTSTTLTTLDQLVTKELSGSGFSRVLVVLRSLEILSENRDDLQTLIDHGLITKVLSWFEAVRDLLTSDLQKSSTPPLSLTEGFYDYFLLLGQSSLPVSQLSVVLLQLALSALEPKVVFALRLEAIRTFNSILESLSRELRKLIQNNQNLTLSLTVIICLSDRSQVAEAVLTVGDYELQVSLSEALCRLTPRKDRQQRANQWFSSPDISNAFCDIRDGDFEVDCRRFLNFVNSCHGDDRRVYTFPCRRAFLDSTELFRPKDDKLDEFWIDFNLDSRCVSFFIDEPQGFLWGSVHLLREEVDHYRVQLKDDECSGADTVLSVRLNNPIMHLNSRGQTVKLTFDPEHHRQLEEAAGRVFMSSPRVTDSGGTVQVSPSAARSSGASYSRKKPQSKSQLKILPLSSPSSEEDSSVTTTPVGRRAEFLFDQIRHSTPTYNSGVPVGAELEISQVQEVEFDGSGSLLQQEVFSSNRKRAATDSGYLSGQTEGPSAQRRKAEPQSEKEESASALPEWPREGAEPSVEEEGPFDGGAESSVKREEPVNEPESDLTSGITTAFKAFKAQLEQHFTSCWQKLEAEVLLSLKECQQHISSLLTAVHQHRLVLLQSFENSITDQLSQLEENSASLNSINAQILSFFQSEMQRLGSFCEEQHQRLKSLEKAESGEDRLSSQ
ncbi:synaptonemal complex protein 2-like isoform X2 [Thunnus albacares]|uniref:synaptonemal complex protein 2-like isoform X2 n=1 Tax=Thunnus albacares TaxID=8236 RepID=UPI001CF6EC41|nr:synaptonemal complex protein 2-like isoform X2 [Thunnus albacares]